MGGLVSFRLWQESRAELLLALAARIKMATRLLAFSHKVRRGMKVGGGSWSRRVPAGRNFKGEKEASEG